MEEKKLNQNESLEIISKMIKETRTNLERDGGGIYLLWGYLWLIVALAIYFLILKTGDYRVQWLWFAMPLIGYPTMIYMLKKREKGAVTFVGRVIGSIWITIGVAAGLLSLYMVVDYNAYPILFVMALLVNVGVAISGLVIKFKPVIIAGFLGIALSFVMLMVSGPSQILVYAGFAVLMLIIPGHILNNAKRRVGNIKRRGNVARGGSHV
jgi:FtsH-binding integral membrane protein